MGIWAYFSVAPQGAGKMPEDQRTLAAMGLLSCILNKGESLAQFLDVVRHMKKYPHCGLFSRHYYIIFPRFLATA